MELQKLAMSKCFPECHTPLAMFFASEVAWPTSLIEYTASMNVFTLLTLVHWLVETCQVRRVTF